MKFFFIRICIFLFLFLSLIITHDGFYHPVKGVFIVLILFQLSLYYPLFLPLKTVIVIGILEDILSCASLGFYTSFFIIMRLFLDGQKDYLFFKDFYYVWGIFTLFLILNMILYHMCGWHNLVRETIWGCCLYPISAKVIQQIFHKSEKIEIVH